MSNYTCILAVLFIYCSDEIVENWKDDDGSSINDDVDGNRIRYIIFLVLFL